MSAMYSLRRALPLVVESSKLKRFVVVADEAAADEKRWRRRPLFDAVVSFSLRSVAIALSLLVLNVEGGWLL